MRPKPGHDPNAPAGLVAGGPDPQTYKRSTHAALLGLITQIVVLAVVGLLALFAGSNAFSLLTYHLIGGVFIWTSLWLLHNQHRLERIEALEAEALAQTDQTAATIFDEAGDQLALARARLTNLYRYVLPGISLGLAIYLLALGTYWSIKFYKQIDFNAQDGVNYDALINGSLANSAVTHVGAMALVLLAMTFACFLVARYVAGMTRVDAWSTLRGGAAYLMGNALSLLLVGIGMVGAFFESPFFLAIVPIALSVIMILLGIEVVFSFIFGIYRPRRAGETPRVAFDSRLLGWLVRPESLGSIISETVNYQFGLEISKTWFYQLIGRALAPLALVCLLLLIAMSSIVVVGPDEMAVLTTNGRVAANTDSGDVSVDEASIVGPGVHFKLPWPLGQAIKKDVTKVQTLAVGSYNEYGENVTAILWTNTHHGETGADETYLLTAPAQRNNRNNDARKTDPGLAAGLAGGRLNVNYRIAGDDEATTKANLLKFINAASKPSDILRSISERELANYFATHDIEHLLSQARGDIAKPDTGLAQAIQASADNYNNGEGLGVEIVHVALTSIHPPQAEEVASSFQQRINARYEKDIAVYEAEKTQTSTLAEVAGSVEAARTIYEQILAHQTKAQAASQMAAGSDERQNAQAELEANRLAIIRQIEEAGGLAAKELLQARAKRWQIVTKEAADANRFEADLKTFDAAPEGYIAKMLLYKVLADELPGKRLYIDATEHNQPSKYRLNLEDRSTGSLITGE